MKSFDTINVIPFIDVLLVLLAMVLTTATFVNSGQLDIALPTATATGEHSVVEPIEIAIDESEQLYLDGVALSMEELDKRLSERRSKVDERTTESVRGSPDGDIGESISPVRLSVDEEVRFQRFVSVADLFKRLSMDDVSIVTRRSP